MLAINQWINTKEVPILKTKDFLLQVQQISLRGTDVIQGVRPDNATASLVTGSGVAWIAPKTNIDQLLASLSDKIDLLLSQPEVNSEALKVWASTVLIAIHPFRDRNGTSARALMAFIDRKRGVSNVEVADPSENVFRFAEAHEAGLDMMIRIFIHETYPQFKFPKPLFSNDGNKSKKVKFLEYLANKQGKSYDDIVKEMVRFSITSINKETINDHPIVKEAEELSVSLRFVRDRDLIIGYRQRGIALYPAE